MEAFFIGSAGLTGGAYLTVTRANLRLPTW